MTRPTDRDHPSVASTFAWTMEQHGAKISEIQRKLGHKSIATTSLYLQALTSEENPYAEAIEQTLMGGGAGVDAVQDAL